MVLEKTLESPLDCKEIQPVNLKEICVHVCVQLCDPMDCSMPGFTVHHQFLEFTEIHVH